MLKLFILFVFVATALADYEGEQQFAWWDTDDNKQEFQKSAAKTIPFPQCLKYGTKSNYLKSSNLDKLFDSEYRELERDAKNEQYVNKKKHNYDKMDEYDDDYGNQHISAAAAVKLTRKIMTKLACNLTGTDFKSLESILHKFNMPEELCTSHKKVDCSEMSFYRTPSGICNNLDRPHLGNSHTAFGRLLPANYQDRISEPRRKKKNGEPLPSCRKLSLSLGSKPVFDRVFNNFFTTFGQLIAHDIALSVPVTDTSSTPITSCECESKYYWDKCNVIDVRPDDPYLGGQKCMAFPATAQAFKGEICSLGVKEQLNGNTAFVDASTLYGNTKSMAAVLRGVDGKLKSTRRHGSMELPPAQREGKSCTDATEKHKCFAGGDSRVMLCTVLTGIHTTFLRAHNQLAEILKLLPEVPQDTEIFELAKSIVTKYFQKVTYSDWLPMLIGTQYNDNTTLCNFFFSKYDSDVEPVVYNEVATAAFRLHSLVRDLNTRCTPDGKRIDQLWLSDIMNKGKYAYDIENYGVDSFICGAIYDYGFSFDTNFAHQIHHRLFETTGQYGKLWRNDLIAINICRGREHGLPSYTALREYCGGKKAYDFTDLGDRINYVSMKKLEELYDGDVDAIDAFVGLNAEDPAPGALVGPTTACLLKKQFDVLKYGDRFFYTHNVSYCSMALQIYPYRCFICSTAALNKVPYNPFMPPSDKNPLLDCDECGMNFDEYVGAACFDIFKTPDDAKLFSDTIHNFLEDFVKDLPKQVFSEKSRDAVFDELFDTLNSTDPVMQPIPEQTDDDSYHHNYGKYNKGKEIFRDVFYNQKHGSSGKKYMKHGKHFRKFY